MVVPREGTTLLEAVVAFEGAMGEVEGSVKEAGTHPSELCTHNVFQLRNPRPVITLGDGS